MNPRIALVTALVGALVIALFATIFALQNPNPTFIHLFNWNFQAPLALVLFITLGMGVIIGLLLLVPSLIKREMKIRQKNKHIKELDESLNEYQTEAEKSQKRTRYLEQNLEPPEDRTELS